MCTRRKLKLFVWEDVLTDCTSGVMFALAHDTEEARQVILAKDGTSPTVCSGLAQAPKVYESTVGFAVWGGG